MCSLRSRARSIEKVRSATSDDSGQYRITNLPVGVQATFTLAGFTRQEHDDIVLTSGFTAPVNATLTVGQLAETVTVVGTTPTVDVQSARQATTFVGAEYASCPARNIRSLLTLTPGLTAGLGADCVGAPASGATTTSTTWPPTPRPLTLMP